MKILFTRNHKLFGAGIRLVTASPWNHVDILFDDGTLIGAVGLNATESSWRGGVQNTTFDHRMNHCGVTAHKVYHVTVQDEKAAKEFAVAQIGKPYDWGAILGFMAFTRDWQDESKWFCSELAAATCLAGGTKLINRPMSRIVPGVLEWSPLLIEM